MPGLTDPRFWAGAGLAVFAMRLAPPGARARWFGGLDLAVLACWVGPGPAAGALALAGLLWLRLRLRPGPAAGPAGLPGVVAGIGLLLLAHKLGPGGPAEPAALALLAVLGPAYACLRAVDLACGVLQDGLPLLDPLACCGYLFPFHMLLAGPVNPYAEHLAMDREGGPPPDLGLELVEALDRITSGLVCKFVLAEQWRALAFGPGAPLRAAGRVDTAFLLIYLFFDFAGYSRVAEGLGRALGVPTPENFLAPFRARTVTEFFGRWHASLGRFVQRRIYLPTQMACLRRWGRGGARRAGAAALLAAWVFVGLWHRISFGLFGYGLAMAAVLLVEKELRDRALRIPALRGPAADRVGAVLGPIYVVAAVSTLLYPVMAQVIAP